jgi:hypothetical protein
MVPQVDGELDIVGRHRDAIVPPHTGPQVDCPLHVIGRVFPAAGEPTFQNAVLVRCRQLEKKEEFGSPVAGDSWSPIKPARI